MNVFLNLKNYSNIPVLKNDIWLLKAHGRMCTDNFAQTGSRQLLTLTRTTVNYYESFEISHFVAFNKSEMKKITARIYIKFPDSSANKEINIKNYEEIL